MATIVLDELASATNSGRCSLVYGDQHQHRGEKGDEKDSRQMESQAGSCRGEVPLKRNSYVYCPAAVSIGVMSAIYVVIIKTV